MRDKEFDDILKNKLEAQKSYNLTDDWETFKHKWDTASTESDIESNDIFVDEFDNNVKQEFEKIRAPYNAAHWILLKIQYEEYLHFRNNLYLAKVVELSILGLLVFGMLNIWPIKKDVYNFAKDSKKYALIIDDNHSNISLKEDLYHTEKSKLVSKRNTNEVNSQAIVSNQHFEHYGKKINVDLSVTKSALQTSLIIDANVNGTRIAYDIGNVERIIGNNSIGIGRIDNLKQRGDVITTIEKKTFFIPFINIKESKIIVPIRPIVLPNMSTKQNQSISEKTVLNFAVGPKVNFIDSPFDPVYEIDPYNTFNTNFNISAKIEKEIGSINIYTGLGYTNTSYIPKIVREKYNEKENEINETSLENIQFKTFNVPIGVKADLFSSDTYSIYAAAGVNVCLIGIANYKVLDNPIGRAKPSTFITNQNGRFNVNENTKLSQKEFSTGVFNGASLKDNLYASATLSFGCQKQISETIGLFVEPSYSHFISSEGIGPNRDKVHSFSVDLGMRYQL
ncbi:MAG: hypothetical protein V3V14_10110 [Saprospiraceae bacterium]